MYALKIRSSISLGDRFSFRFMGYFYNALLHTIRDIDARCRVMPCKGGAPLWLVST